MTVAPGCMSWQALLSAQNWGWGVCGWGGEALRVVWLQNGILQPTSPVDDIVLLCLARSHNCQVHCMSVRAGRTRL